MRSHDQSAADEQALASCFWPPGPPDPPKPRESQGALAWSEMFVQLATQAPFPICMQRSHLDRARGSMHAESPGVTAGIDRSAPAPRPTPGSPPYSERDSRKRAPAPEAARIVGESVQACKAAGIVE